MKLHSTVALGDGAFGEVSAFTSAQGERMHFLGNIPLDKVPTHTDETASLKKVADKVTHFFEADGKVTDVRDEVGVLVKGLRLFCPVPFQGKVQIRLGYAVAQKMALQPNIFAEWDLAVGFEGITFPRSLAVKYDDPFEVRISVPYELSLPKADPKMSPRIEFLRVELDVDPLTEPA